jgi:hypothetical protein
VLDKIKHVLSRAMRHVEEHKLLYGVGALGAGLGYLFVSSQTSMAAPVLKATTPTPTPMPVPVVPPLVVPAPLTSVSAGDILIVSTLSTGLTARSGAGVTYPQVGTYPKGGPLVVLGGPQNGFIHVHGPGIDMQGNQLAFLEGWASASYLRLGTPNPALQAASMLHDLGMG